MVRFPVPTAREVRWGFYLVAVCALTLTLTLGWAIIHKVNQSDDLVAIAATSSAQVDRLSDQIDAQAVTNETRQRQLRAQNKLLHQQLTTLLRFLRRHGIAVPQTALGPASRSSTSPKAPAPSGASFPSHSHGSTAGPVPTPTPSPSIAAVTDSVCKLLHLDPCPFG